MIEEQKTETFPLTLEIAKQFNRMQVLAGDRDPGSQKGIARVSWLYAILRAGDFYSPTWSRVKIKSKNGKIYRVDGGHSSHMLVHCAGVDFPEGLSVTVRTFHCADISEAVYLYELFNQNKSTRTDNDLIKNRIAYVPTLKSLAPSSVYHAIRGVARHSSLWHPRGEYNKLDAIYQEPQFVKWAMDFVGRREFKKPGVLAAMFATFKKDQKVANVFWQSVRDATANQPTCPSRTLSTFVHTLVYDRNAPIKWNARAQYVKCIHAWNAYRNGNTTSLHYHKKSQLPVAK
jgi:hypothetical protein